MTARVQTYTDANATKVIAEHLQKVLADTFTLYFKTHSYHWNVEGNRFHSLHEMFEEQYTEMWQAIDEIAERLRAIDEYAPVSLAELMKNASMSEADKVLDADSMVDDLAAGHTKLAGILAEALEAVEEVGDDATGDMFIARIQTHEKTAWMLRAINK